MSDVATVLQRNVLVDAIQWTSPEQGHELAEWSGGRYDPHTSGGIGPAGEDWGRLTVDTHAGVLTVCPHDHLVHTVTGEFRPFTVDAYHANFAA
jgi:hypothetical protein